MWITRYRLSVSPSDLIPWRGCSTSCCVLWDQEIKWHHVVSAVSPALRQDSAYLVPDHHQSRSSHQTNAPIIIDMAGLQYSLASLPAQHMVREPPVDAQRALKKTMREQDKHQRMVHSAAAGPRGPETPVSSSITYAAYQLLVTERKYLPS